jgi:2-polyprenyl-3-methyl-5-hydroxy-6-metoxy-1,4-benzoquinol methylase
MIENKIKYLLKFTPFYQYHIRDYVRNLHFLKCVKKLPVENFTCILDAGCGNGTYAKKVAKKYSHLKIDACDLKGHEERNVGSKNINFQQLDLLELRKENYYDFCYNIDVLEHTPNN